jgi:hypothetical protein
MLTLEWQPLTTGTVSPNPKPSAEAGARDDWNRVMDASAELYEALAGRG